MTIREPRYVKVISANRLYLIINKTNGYMEEEIKIKISY